MYFSLYSLPQTLQSLHIDLSSTSPSGSIQTTTTPLDSPAYYWTPGPPATAAAAMKEGGRSGSFRRPHPCSMPVTQSAYKRLPQRGSTSSSTTSTSSTTQILYMAFDDTITVAAETRSQLPAIQDGYLETDV